MTARIAKIALRFLLPLYFAVFALMPLSNIHIEGRQNGCNYLTGSDRHKDTIHLLLHELLYAHFQNKSEHLGNVTFVAPDGNKRERQYDQLMFNAVVDTSVISAYFARRLPDPGSSRQDYGEPLSFTASGLSPPTA